MMLIYSESIHIFTKWYMFGVEIDDGNSAKGEYGNYALVVTCTTDTRTGQTIWYQVTVFLSNNIWPFFVPYRTRTDK